VSDPGSAVMADPSRTALLMIECQRGVVGDLSVLPDLAAAAQPILETIGRLAGEARRHGVSVVHLTYAPLAEGRSTNQRSRLTRGTASTSTWGPERPGAEVVAVIGVEPGDLVFERHQGISPVHRTEVLAVLRNMGIVQLVVTGVSTNLAVPAVAVGAADEDFSVVVVPDATIGVPESHHRSMLRYSLSFVASLLDADQVVAAWQAGPSS
jgi:nicotinamidase-related amidase